MAFNRDYSSNRNIVSYILKQAKSEFLYLYEGKRLSKDEVLQVIEGLNQMGKSLKFQSPKSGKIELNSLKFITKLTMKF